MLNPMSKDLKISMWCAASMIILSNLFMWYFLITPLRRNVSPDSELARPRLLIGKVLESGPLQMKIEAIGERRGGVYDVVYGAHTQFYVLTPWQAGEYDTAKKEFDEYIERTKPKPGTYIPPAPGSMKMGPTSAAVITNGAYIGLLSSEPIIKNRDIVANVVRPLLISEIDAEEVGLNFPKPPGNGGSQ
jgi:hypothetical protein